MIQLGSVGWDEGGSCTGYTELLKLLSRGKSNYSDTVNTCVGDMQISIIAQERQCVLQQCLLIPCK